MKRFGPKARLFAAAAMAILVAACDDDRRAVDAPPPAPLADLEGLSELPYAEPAQVQYYEPERAYPYAERAYGVQRAFYDAPPDYGFAYDDVSPYVWESDDDWALYAEPWEGDYRYYYYEADAAYPYFVRDRDYGYAYGPTGILIAMFYPDGRYVPAEVAYRTAPLAGRYYARGHDLRRASRTAPRLQVDDRVWVTEAPKVSRSADPWLRAARDDRRWREWRERDGDRELRRFAVETQRRQAAAGAWRERTARQRVATIERGEDRLEAQALRARREAAKEAAADGRRETAPDARGRGEAGRRNVEQRQAQTEQRAQAERRGEAQAQAQRQQVADAKRDKARREPPQAKPEPKPAQVAHQPERRRQEALRRQMEAASLRDRQPQAQRAEQTQPRKAEVKQRQQAPASAEQPKQARAPSAVERGQPVATQEEGGKARGKGKDERRKD